MPVDALLAAILPNGLLLETHGFELTHSRVVVEIDTWAAANQRTRCLWFAGGWVYDLMNSRRSALMMSACVVGIPCGIPW